MALPTAEEANLADKISAKLKKVENGSYFSFDKDYSSSNSVDRDFLSSLINKDDFGSFKDSYING